MDSKEQWQNNLKMLRFRKDKFFKSNDDSPIPIDQRERFDGLEYYEPNYDLRFILELDELENKEPIEVNDSAGNIRDMLIWGAFHFQVDGTDCTLQAYKSRVGENRLFIPYKDETNEEETYGAGRYIDLYEEKDHTEDGKWILDFNYSTLPWCAYNENYACPYVPPTNWLDAKIKAGEKNYSFEKLS